MVEAKSSLLLARVVYICICYHKIMLHALVDMDFVAPPCWHLLLVLFLRNSWHWITHHYRYNLIFYLRRLRWQFKISRSLRILSRTMSVTTNGINRKDSNGHCQESWSICMMRFENFCVLWIMVGNAYRMDGNFSKFTTTTTSCTACCEGKNTAMASWHVD